jgi:hypothetical protein
MEQMEAVEKLKDHYKKGKLVLVLGAGVSQDFGIPDWSMLLRELMITTLDIEQNDAGILAQLFQKIFTQTPLSAGRYFEEYYKRECSLQKAVRDVLYKNYKIDKESKVMEEIVHFCVPNRNSHNLDCVITYNYDNILEEQIFKKNRYVQYKSIYEMGMNPTDQELPIYHVHGYLPKDKDKELPLNNQIVFGESSYHKQYTDIYSWNNFLQINKFRDSNCLFIGLSFTDPNFRRLLDIAKRQKGTQEISHFIFKVKYKEDTYIQRLQNLLKDVKLLTDMFSYDEKQLEMIEHLKNDEKQFNETVEHLINIAQKTQESDTLSFGVDTIWIDDWDDIPTIMEKIRT